MVSDKLALRGRKIVRSFSMHEGIVQKVDEIAAQIKRGSGLHVDRSKLLGVLCELLIDAQCQIVSQRIEDLRSLRDEVARAIVAQRSRRLRVPPSP